jgi:hypothetical protein
MKIDGYKTVGSEDLHVEFTLQPTPEVPYQMQVGPDLIGARRIAIIKLLAIAVIGAGVCLYKN